MTDRGPNLERGLQKLPGISVTVDTAKCTGCGICVDRCFVAAMTIQGGVACPGESCKGCGRCVELCPEGAITLRIENENELYRQLIGRVKEVADIWQGQPPRT
jgi:UDP-glucose 4-epimerase